MDYNKQSSDAALSIQGLGLHKDVSNVPPGWQSQDKFVRHLEKEPLKNGMNYACLEYGEHDWDNIPSVVPRFIFHIQKYTKHITQHLSNQGKLESVQSLRKDHEKRLIQLDNQFTVFKETDSLFRTKTEQTIQACNDFEQKLQQDLKALKTKILYRKSVIGLNSKVEEDCITELYKKYISDFLDAEEAGHPTDNMDNDEQWVKNRDFAINTPRLISINGFVKLFEQVQYRSNLRKRIDHLDHEIVTAFEDIKQLFEQDSHLENKLKEVEEKNEKQAQSIVNDQKDINSMLKRNIDELIEGQKQHFSMIRQLQIQTSNNKTITEQLGMNLLTFKEDLNQLRHDSQTNMRQIKEDLNDQIESTDRYMNEINLAMNQEINEVRLLATEAMKKQEKELVDRFSDQFNQVKTYMTANIEDMQNKQAEQKEKVNKSIAQIKKVCSDYFADYEKTLEEQRVRTHILENKYKEWAKVLLEPATVNDARLYSVETRIKEEEDMRIKEYDFLRDLIRKLIYSLEQVNMAQLDRNQSLIQDQSQQSMLPNLLVPNTTRNSSNKFDSTPSKLDKSLDSMTKGIEFMMIKRLNFLRNSLDAHNPELTTAKLRQNAQQVRNERIKELWKNEQNMPTVSELLREMRNKTTIEPRKDFDVVHTESEEFDIQAKQNSLFSTVDDAKLQTSRQTAATMSAVNRSVDVPKGQPGNTLSIQTSKMQTVGAIHGTPRTTQPYASIENSYHQRNQSMKAKLASNINSKKFTTNIDDQRQADIDREIREIAQVKHKRKIPTEPFWQDYSEQISAICKEKENQKAPNRHGKSLKYEEKIGDLTRLEEIQQQEGDSRNSTGGTAQGHKRRVSGVPNTQTNMHSTQPQLNQNRQDLNLEETPQRNVKKQTLCESPELKLQV